MLSTIASYQLIAGNMARSLERTGSDPQVTRETKYYLENIGSIKTIDEFLNDFRIYNYAMKAFGLSDMTYAKAFMRKVLEEGVTSNDAFANKLVDKRYREFAATFNFQQFGDKTTGTQSAQMGTAQKYLRQSMEEQAGRDNEGVRLALYFQRKASSITNAYAILADPALLKVAQTALGISPMTSGANVDQQAKMLSKRIDFADFKDPAKLDSFLQRFAVMWDVENPQATAANVPAILIGQPREVGMSVDMLMSLQRLKFGR